MSGSRSQSAELLRKLAMNIIDGASMKEHKLFDLVDVTLKDLRCSGSSEHLLRFGGSTAVFAGDYFQVLSVVPSRRFVEEKDGTGHYVNVILPE